MKTFFGSMLGSFLGAIVGLVIVFFITVGIFAGLLKSVKSKEVQHISDNSVLEIKLDHAIQERTPENSFHFDFDDNTPRGKQQGLMILLHVSPCCHRYKNKRHLSQHR